MPRIKQNADAYLRNDFLKAIRVCQANTGLMQKKELSEASDIPYTTLWRRLQEPEEMTIAEFRKLLSVLPLSPAVLLAFAGYDGKTVKKFKEESA